MKMLNVSWVSLIPGIFSRCLKSFPHKGFLGLHTKLSFMIEERISLWSKSLTPLIQEESLVCNLKSDAV